MPGRKDEENPMSGWILPPAGMFNLRSATDVAFLKLARRESLVKDFLTGLYKEAAKWEGRLPKGWTDESVKKFWDTMTGDVKHKVTKCIKEMEGKGVDPGAFCASLADKVEGTAWRHKKRKAAKVASRFLKKSRKEVYVDVRELPTPIQKALREVKYGRKNIMVEESRTYQMSSLSGTGRKGFTIAVNLGTGRYQVEWGSWGGPNMFNPDNPVDLDTKSRPIPPNNVVISGVMGGGNPTYATIKAHPDNLTKLLGAGDEDDITEEQKTALAIIGGIKGGYRKDYFRKYRLGEYSPNNPLLIEMAKMGLIKIMRNGAMKITTKGQNARGGKRVLGKMISRVATRYLQSKYVVVTPAYGRDYTSKAKAIADWEAGKDFILQDITSRWDGKPINKEDAKRAGFSAVNIRFKRNTQVAVVKLAKTALKVEPIPSYEAERIQQAIQFHNSEAIESTQMADDIERAWDRWDLRTLASYQVLSRNQMRGLKDAMKMGEPDEDFLRDIGGTIKEHLEALRTEAWEHRKEAQAIEKAWQKHDMRALKRMRVIRGQEKKAQIDRTVAVLLQAGKAALIHENGNVEEIVPANGKDFKLQELQKVVKGYIEIVPMGRIIMVANEEGLMKNMRPNAKATRMHGGQVIVGPVVVCPSKMVK